MALAFPSSKRREREYQPAAYTQEQSNKRATTAQYQINNDNVRQHGGPRRDTTMAFELAVNPDASDDWSVPQFRKATRTSEATTMGRAIAQPVPRQGGPVQFPPGMYSPPVAEHGQALPAGAFAYNASQYSFVTQPGSGIVHQFPLAAQPAPYAAGTHLPAAEPALHSTGFAPYPASLPPMGNKESAIPNSTTQAQHPVIDRGFRPGTVKQQHLQGLGYQPTPRPSFHDADAYNAQHPNDTATAGGFQPSPGVAQVEEQNASSGSRANLGGVSPLPPQHAPTNGHKAGKSQPAGPANQKSRSSAPNNSHGGGPRSSQPRTARQQQEPGAPQDQTRDTHRGVIERGSRIYSLPFWLSESLHAALSSTISQLPDSFDTTILSHEDLLSTNNYVAGNLLSSDDLRANIVPGIPITYLRDFIAKTPKAMYPDAIFGFRSLEPDQRLEYHLDFVALGLLMQELGSHSVVYWGVWNLIKHKTSQLLKAEFFFHCKKLPIKDKLSPEEFVRRQQPWIELVYEQSRRWRHNSQSDEFEEIFAGNVAGVKRSAQLDREADITNAQKKVRNNGHSTPGHEQSMPQTELRLIGRTAKKSRAWEWSFLQAPGESLEFSTPDQLKQPGGYALPPPADLSFLQKMTTELRQSLDQDSETRTAHSASPVNLNLGQQLASGPFMSPPAANSVPSMSMHQGRQTRRAPIVPSPSVNSPRNRIQALTLPNFSSASRPILDQNKERNFIDITDSTDVAIDAHPGQVSASAESQHSASPPAKVTSKGKSKTGSGPMFKPQDDPRFKQNGIETWKIEYPGDTPELQRPEPPFTSYEDYGMNAKGLYRCLCEFGQTCGECETGADAAGLKRKVRKKLDTWRGRIERLIDAGQLNGQHKTWKKDPRKPRMTEEEKEQGRDLRNEKREAEYAAAAGYEYQAPSSVPVGQQIAMSEQPPRPQVSAVQAHNQTANQYVASSGRSTVTPGYNRQQASSSKSGVQPPIPSKEPPEEPPKPLISAAGLHDSTANLRKVYIRKYPHADVEYFDTYWAAKNAEKLGQTLTLDQEFWAQQIAPSKISIAALDRFWASNYPQSTKGMEAQTRIVAYAAEKRAKEDAEKREKEEAEERAKQEEAKETAVATLEAEERDRALKEAQDVAPKMDEDDSDSLFAGSENEG